MNQLVKPNGTVAFGSKNAQPASNLPYLDDQWDFVTGAITPIVGLLIVVGDIQLIIQIDPRPTSHPKRFCSWAVLETSVASRILTTYEAARNYQEAHGMVADVWEVRASRKGELLLWKNMRVSVWLPTSEWLGKTRRDFISRSALIRARV